MKLQELQGKLNELHKQKIASDAKVNQLISQLDKSKQEYLRAKSMNAIQGVAVDDTLIKKYEEIETKAKDERLRNEEIAFSISILETELIPSKLAEEISNTYDTLSKKLSIEVKAFQKDNTILAFDKLKNIKKLSDELDRHRMNHYSIANIHNMPTLDDSAKIKIGYDEYHIANLDLRTIKQIFEKFYFPYLSALSVPISKEKVLSQFSNFGINPIFAETGIVDEEKIWTLEELDQWRNDTFPDSTLTDIQVDNNGEINRVSLVNNRQWTNADIKRWQSENPVGTKITVDYPSIEKDAEGKPKKFYQKTIEGNVDNTVFK